MSGLVAFVAVVVLDILGREGESASEAAAHGQGRDGRSRESCWRGSHRLGSREPLGRLLVQSRERLQMVLPEYVTLVVGHCLFHEGG
jgi:hypothetical protein